MSKKILNIEYFNGGLADSEREGIRGAFFFAKNLNIFSEPTNLTLMPEAVKESSTTVVDLVKWIVPGTPHDTNTYAIGDTGKFYKRTSAGSWSVLQTTSNCVGQGMELQNDYVYYTQNTQIGRYGPLSGTPAFTDAWQTGLNDTSTSKFAPIKAFLNGFAVGHGNKLSWWDGSVWTLAKLTLPAGFNIRSLEVIDEYLAIGTWVGTSITASESGYVFFWDGTSTTFNFFTHIPEGGVNALLNSRNRLLTVAGSNGYIYLNTNPFQKVHKFPKLEYSKNVEVYPGAVSNWKGIASLGLAGSTDSTSVEQGVYEWGAKSDKYNETLNLGYTISTGTTQSITVQIGAVKGIGSIMLIGWRDNTTYGVDKVIQTADVYATGTYESLIFDDKRPHQDKLAITLKATHKALVSGQSIQLGYKVNRTSSYTTDTANSTVDTTETRLPIPASVARFRDFQMEVILASTAATGPTVTSVALEYDDLTEESLF